MKLPNIRKFFERIFKLFGCCFCPTEIKTLVKESTVSSEEQLREDYKAIPKELVEITWTFGEAEKP